MSYYEEPQPSEVVSLVTRNEGDYVVHATASVYGGGSAVASPASKDGQVHDLQEALNEKELELMELKQQHSQLQTNSNHAQGNWVAALESKDRAIHQLEGALKSKERAISALSEREQIWQETKPKTGEEQLEHEHKVQLLRSQVAQANANVLALRAHLEAEQSSVASRSGRSPSRPTPRALSMVLPQDSVDNSPHKSPPRIPPKRPVTSARRRSHTEAPSADRHRTDMDDPLPRHKAPPPTLYADIAAARAFATNSSNTAVRPPSAPGNLQGCRRQEDPDQLPRHRALPDTYSHDVSVARVLEHNAAQSSTPAPDATAAGNVSYSRRVSWSPPRNSDRTSQLQEEATFANLGHPSLHSTADAGGHEPHEQLLSNVYRARDVLRQMGGDPAVVQGHLWDILQDQEALLRGGEGMGGYSRGAVAESVDSLVPAAPGVSAAQFGMLQERAHSAAACAMQLQEENEELQGRVVQLRVDNEELRSMVSDHESSILELHLNNDMLTARLADAAADLGPDPSQQDTSQSGRAEAANSAGQLAEELEKVQKRLVNRDAAAKKYKEGCRTLKERVEQLQQVCQKLKERNIELVDAAPKAAAVQAQHEQELRKLLTQAQEDIEKHRKLAAAAQRDKQGVLDQLDDMQREMKDTVAAQEEAARRAQEETARRTEAMVEEERSRTSLMMRQARGEVEQEAAAASEEASLVLSRAEQLRQAAADTEAAATRRIEAANESTRIAETRLAEAREEVSRMQQRLLASEEAASRDTRKMDTLARDVKAEQQHAAATLERLERAHLRVQHLESQLAEADDVVSKHKEAKRNAEAETADVRFKLQQAERRTKQETLATAAVQERLEAAIARTREAEARMAEAEHEAADQASGFREWEARVRDSEETCAVAERKLQELKGALSRAEAEKSSLRETMVQTETLIKQARHEHEQEISEASEAAAAECEALQQKCNDLQLAVERERSGRERAEHCMQEAHGALEKHRESLEDNHTASLKAATTIHSLKERLRDKHADLEARDTSILELQGKLSQAHVRLQQQLATKDSLLQARQLEAAEYADKENQLRAAQARLAEVAPLMRRLAGRSDNRIKAVGRR